MTRYKKGKIISGTVTGIEKYGIFVGLDEFYSGLIHISEVSNGFVNDVNEFVHIGETIHAKVIDVDEDSCHVKLSIKNIEYRSGKKRRQHIVETERGFQPLADCLDCWIEKKIKEIKKN